MSKLDFPSYDQLYVWFWRSLDDKTYGEYVLPDEWVSKMSILDSETLYLLVWHSEGCPDVLE